MAGWRITLWAVLVLAALGFLYLVRGILLPFVLAIVISVVLDPSIRKLRMRGMSRGAAVALVGVLFFGMMTLLGIWLTPVIGQQISNFRTTVERFGSGISQPDPNQNFFVKWNPVVVVEAPQQKDMIDQVLTDFKPILSSAGLPTTRKAIYDQYIAPNSKQIASGVQSFFNGFFGIIGTLTSQLFLLIFTPILVFMILADLERLKRRSVTWIPPSIRASTVDTLSDIGNVFTSYLRGVTLAVCLYMAIAAVLLLLMGAPYAILLGILFGITYMIPYIGAAISTTILFLTAGLSGKTDWLFLHLPSAWAYAGLVVAVYFLFDRVFDMLVFPRIIGSSVGLNPVVSMFVILAGGALFGLPGMLLAFPMAGAVKVVLDRVMKFTLTPGDDLKLPAIPLRHRP